MDLGAIEDMQWATAIECDEVCDIDQFIDGSETDRNKSLLQPVRRWAVLGAPDQPQSKSWAQRWRLSEVQRDFDGTGKRALHRLRDFVFVGADGRRAEIASNAGDASTIRPVGREVDFDHGIA